MGCVNPTHHPTNGPLEGIRVKIHGKHSRGALKNACIQFWPIFLIPLVLLQLRLPLLLLLVASTTAINTSRAAAASAVLCAAGPEIR